MKDSTLSGYQLALLLMGFSFGSTAILVPSTFAGQDVWLAFIMGWAGGFILMWIYVTISKAHPNKTLIQILKTCFGKYLGSLVGICYIWYSIHLASLVFRNFGEYMNVSIYFDTPQIFIISCLAIILVYTGKKGLVVFGRAAEMLVPYLFLFVPLTFLLLVKEYNVANMLPILENGIAPVTKVAFGVLTFPFGETVIFLMVFPFYKQPEKLKQIAFVSLLTVGCFLLMAIFRDLWSLGPDMIERGVFPPTISTMLIPDVTLDPMVAVDLLIGGWIKIGICIYAASLGISQLINLDDYKLFVIPVTIICVILSIIIYENIFEMIYWATGVYSLYAVPFQIVFPLLLLGITKFKKWQNG